MQIKWLAHKMMGDCLLRIKLVARMEGKRQYEGRDCPGMMLMNWMMKKEYSKLNERAGVAVTTYSR